MKKASNQTAKRDLKEISLTKSRISSSNKERKQQSTNSANTLTFDEIAPHITNSTTPAKNVTILPKSASQTNMSRKTFKMTY